MDRSSTQAEWVAGAAPLFPNLPPVVVFSRWPDGQASETGLLVIVDGKHLRSRRVLIRSPLERKSMESAQRLSAVMSVSYQKPLERKSMESAKESAQR